MVKNNGVTELEEFIMSGFIWFFIGMTVGGFLGIMFLSMLQINRINHYERQIFMLWEQLEKLKGKDPDELLLE